METKTEVAAAVYARISSDDDGRALGVKRQIADCEAEAERRGWTVAARFIDNDVSATRSKVRPQYQQMLAAIRRGDVTGLIVWDVDRLTRAPRELEDVIDLADRYGLALASLAGEIDLATGQGRMMARVKGSLARYETDQLSRRMKRKTLERAEAGQPHGMIAYGYRRIIDYDGNGKRIAARDVPEPEQAEVIRTSTRRILAGESVRSVTRSLNEAGSTTARGGKWSSEQLRMVLLRPRNAGLRTHQGKVIGPGNWPAIIDRATFDRITALLTDPARATNKGAKRRHLLSNIARCGICGSGMVVNPGHLNPAKTKRYAPGYWCNGCHRVRRVQAPIDETVEALVIARLSKPDALMLLATGDADEVERARAEVAALTAKLDITADDYAADRITAAQLHRITEGIRPRIKSAEARIIANTPSRAVAELAGPEAEKRWHTAPLDVKRTVIDLLMTVTVLPSPQGRRAFDPETDLRIDWRQ